MKRRLGMIVLLFTLASPCANGFGAGELEQIREAIKEKGAHWVAEDNPIFRLPPEERKRLCGAILEDHHLGIRWEGSVTNKSFPPKFDWRNKDDHNWMTSVKDQGPCGSCWAFGALGAFEGLIKVYTNSPNSSIDLSEQDLLSCSGGSCDGWSIYAVCHFLQQKGIPDEGCFPYRARDDIPCDDRCSDYEMRMRKASSFGPVSSSIEDIKSVLMSGPLEVGFDVYSDFMAYSSGVYQHVWGDRRGGHAVTMLGWSDVDSCWICKNSWGRGWGEYGSYPDSTRGWFRIKWGECEIENWVYWMIPEPTSYPYIKFASYLIQELSGDGDGVLNPGEVAEMEVTLANEGGWGEAWEVWSILDTQDSLVSIQYSIGSFGDIPSGETSTNSVDPFRLSVPEIIPVGKVPFTLLTTASGNYTTNLFFDVEVSWNQAYWPQVLHQTVNSSPLVMGLDDDGENEVIFTAGYSLYVKDKTGIDKPGFPFTTEGRVWSSPAVGDVNGDGKLDIAIGSSDMSIYVLDRSGNLITSLKTDKWIIATPVLSDLDDDGKMEVIVGNMGGKLYVIRDDGSEFNQNFPYSVESGIMAGAAVGDLEGGGAKDIVFGTIDGWIYAISSQGDPLPGWPFKAGKGIFSPPSMANLDGEGTKVIVGSLDDTVYVLNSDGSVEFKLPTSGPIKSSPSLVDLDGDGELEIFFGSSDGKIYAYHSDGLPVQGWPKEIGAMIQSSVSFSDLDNDGEPEVVVGGRDGELYAFRANGDNLSPFPISDFGAIASTPSIADLDKDGDLEVVFGDTQGIQMIDYKPKSENVGKYWSMFRGVPSRTGNYEDVITYGVEDNGRGLSRPLCYSLYQNYPNPFNSSTEIRYSLPKKSLVMLEVYNILGQRVSVLVNGEEKPGYKRVFWKPVDLASGIYFYCLRVDNRYVQSKKMLYLK